MITKIAPIAYIERIVRWKNEPTNQDLTERMQGQPEVHRAIRTETLYSMTGRTVSKTDYFMSYYA